MEVNLDIEEAKLEATREQVEKELDDWYQLNLEGTKRYGGDLDRVSRWSYINNFQERLPNNVYPEGRAELFYLKNLSPKLDETLYQFRVRTGQDDVVEANDKSPLRMHTTFGDFYKLIDSALEKEGITLEKLQQMFERLEEANKHNRYEPKERDKYPEEFDQKLLPVYIRLRAAGFNHKDLSA